MGSRAFSLDCTLAGALPGHDAGTVRLQAIPQRWQWDYKTSLHPSPSVRVEVPRPTGGDSVFAEYSGSKGIKLEKQSPILRCERRAYRMNDIGRVCR